MVELKFEKIKGHILKFYKQDGSNWVRTHAYKNGKLTHSYDSKNKETAIRKFKDTKPYDREKYGE